MKNKPIASIPASSCPSCGVTSPKGAHADAASCIRALEAEVLQLREELDGLKRGIVGKEPEPVRNVP